MVTRNSFHHLKVTAFEIAPHGHDEVVTRTIKGTADLRSCDLWGSSGQYQDLRASIYGESYLREQNLRIWECHVQEQQAVVRRGLEEEMLSGQQQGRC